MLREQIHDFYYNFIEETKSYKKVDRTTKYYKIINHDIPKTLNHFLSDNMYKVYGSAGQGNLSQVPWFGIFHRRLTESAKYGVYIVYLYSIEYKKIFLTLNQGFTHFSDMFKRKKFEYARKTADYFAEEISLENFKVGPIKLGDGLSQLAKGYESGTIVYKEYDIDNLPTEEVLFYDLNKLLIEYKEIVDMLGQKSYEDIIKIVNNIDDAIAFDKAIDKIKYELNETFVTLVDVEPTPKEVKKGIAKSKKYNRIRSSIQRQKLDYIRIARDNARIGLQGEKLALQIERNRLERLGIINIEKKLRWLSNETDSIGYDIASVDIIDGKEVKICIEVKSTSDRVDSPFYVSKNQVEVSNIEKDRYRVLRIFDVDSTQPKYYYAKGPIQDSFILDPVTFLATYKYEVE
jgi:hypothetical protein